MHDENHRNLFALRKNYAIILSMMNIIIVEGQGSGTIGSEIDGDRVNLMIGNDCLQIYL